MNILSIDVAVSKDIAYVGLSNNRLEYFGKIKKLTDLPNIMVFKRLDAVITEDMYLGKNVDILKRLCYVVGGILYICETHYVECRLIAPSTWQSHHGLLKKPAGLRRKIEDTIIATVTNETIEDDDIRAAILMGLCHIEQMKIKEEL